MAAVRRVRQPGCKFDEMLILEQPQQGTDKSSAWAVMAVQEDWFADDLPLNVEGKRVIETLRGRWIVETDRLEAPQQGGHSPLWWPTNTGIRARRWPEDDRGRARQG